MRRKALQVNAIAPGYIETQIATEWWNKYPIRKRRGDGPTICSRRSDRPAGRSGEDRVFLASDEAPFINAATIVIDGGRSALYHE